MAAINGVAAERFIFIDEAGANLQMHPRYGRAYGGQRATLSAPYHRGNSISIIGAISIKKIEALTYCEGACDGQVFIAFINNFLRQILTPAHIVVMDNVAFHKSSAIREAIESTGAKLVFCAPYSPEFNPIEEMWSKVKTLLRNASARTLANFNSSIRKALLAVTASDLFGWFKHAGYLDQDFREAL